MTKLKAIQELSECDHAFLKLKYVEEIADIFGIKVNTRLVQANPQDFKGLSLYDDDENSIKEAYGLEAHYLAEEIADSMKLDYPSQHGIGSRLRVACEAVEKQLTN